MGAYIGHKMRAAAEYVARHPGCTKQAAAWAVTPQSQQYGYAVVDRAIAAGLIEATRNGRAYSLTVTKKGERLCA